MKNISFVIAGAVFFAALSVVLNPFQFDHGNSGRYLLPVLKDMDPTLFSDDPQVEALEGFGSGFYLALSWVTTNLSTSPHDIERVMGGLFVFTRFLLAIALVWLAWELADSRLERWVLISVLLLLFSFPVSVSVAGVSIGFPTMNHATLSEVAMVLSVVFLISRRFVSMTVVNTVDVWIHPLMAVQRLISLGLAAIVGDRARMRPLLALGLIALFGSSVVAYVYRLAPPPLSPDEVAIFLEAKGRMIHTSPFVQPWTSWMLFASLIYLAWFSTRRFGSGLADNRVRLMWLAAGISSVVGISFAALNHVFQNPVLTRFQPMRMFMLSWFILLVLVALGASRAFLMDDASWPWLAASLVTIPIHGGVDVIVCCSSSFVLFLVTADRTGEQKWKRSRVLLTLFAISIVSAGVVSARSYHFVLGSLVVLAICGLSWIPVRRGVMASAILLVAVAAGVVSSHRYFRVESSESTGRPRVDAEYFRTLAWIQKNTAQNARFAVEPPMAFFRARSHRTCANQNISAVVWVDPSLSEEERIRAEQVDEIFEGTEMPSMPAEVKRISGDHGFDHVVTRGDRFWGYEPVYSSGSFFVYQIR